MRSFSGMVAIGAAFFMLAVWPAVALGDETATTHRAGDTVWVRWGCHDPESVMAIATSAHPDELGGVLTEQGKCYYLRRSIPARLLEWMAGPLNDKSGIPGSVWRILDAFGDTEYAIFKDAGGPHAAHRENAT